MKFFVFLIKNENQTSMHPHLHQGIEPIFSCVLSPRTAYQMLGVEPFLLSAMVSVEGLEPPTNGLEIHGSIHLS